MRVAYVFLAFLVGAQDDLELQKMLKQACSVPSAKYVSLVMDLHPNGHKRGQEDCRTGDCYLSPAVKINCRRVKLVAEVKHSSAITEPILRGAFFSPAKGLAKFDGVNVDFTDENENIKIQLPNLVDTTKLHRVITIRHTQVNRIPSHPAPDHVFVKVDDPKIAESLKFEDYHGTYSIIVEKPNALNKPSTIYTQVQEADKENEQEKIPEAPKPRRKTYIFASANLTCPMV